MKRYFDFFSALLGLVCLSPLLLLIAVAVLVSSGYPILFRQQRIGRRGEMFYLVKFRSMIVQIGAEQGAFNAGSNNRVTAVGKVLRKSKLDEVPQLWNVLMGDMSLVGPRPEVQKWVDAYPERWANVLTVRPGITDPASIKFRNEENLLAAAKDPEYAYRYEILPLKLKHYEEYVRRQSMGGDIIILLQTIWVVLRGS